MSQDNVELPKGIRIKDPTNIVACDAGRCVHHEYPHKCTALLVTVDGSGICETFKVKGP